MRLTEQGAGELKTLFIDRDPDTFADICRHLQGILLERRSWLATNHAGRILGRAS